MKVAASFYYRTDLLRGVDEIFMKLKTLGFGWVGGELRCVEYL
jgi:hypothetical protein